jgi:hypothetical protein
MASIRIDGNITTVPHRERRIALGTRRRVAEMTPEEMRRELLTSDVTGLPIAARSRKQVEHLRLQSPMRMDSKR